jgi:DNA mismatch repair protein MutS
MPQKETMMAEYFRLQEELIEKYGEKAIILYQCGGFYEVYSQRKCECDKPESCSKGSLTIPRNTWKKEWFSLDKNQCINCKLIVGPVKGFAEKCSKIWNSGIGGKGRWKMVGFPSGNPGSFGRHVSVLINAGYTVAVYDQHDSANENIMKTNSEKGRLLNKIYSPGSIARDNEEISVNTTTSSSKMMILYVRYDEPDDYFNSVESYEFGISIYNLDTGVISVGYLFSTAEDKKIQFDRLTEIFEKDNIVELLVVTNGISKDKFKKVLNIQNLPSSVIFRKVSKESQDFKIRDSLFKKVFQKKLEIRETPILISLFSLIKFIEEHDNTLIRNLSKPEKILNSENNCILHTTTISQLNILNKESNNPSLLNILNNCSTSYGTNLLQHRLCSPSAVSEEINERLDLVEASTVKWSSFLGKMDGIGRINNRFQNLRLNYKHIISLQKILLNFSKLYVGYITVTAGSNTKLQKYLNKKFDLEKADESLALLKYLRNKFNDDKLKNYKIDDIRKIYVFKKGSNEKIDNLVKNIGDVIEYLDLIANSLRLSIPMIKKSKSSNKKKRVLDTELKIHYLNDKKQFYFSISNPIAKTLKKMENQKGYKAVTAPEIVHKIFENTDIEEYPNSSRKPRWSDVKIEKLSGKQYLHFNWQSTVINFLIDSQKNLKKLCDEQFTEIKKYLFENYSEIMNHLTNFIGNLDVAVSSKILAEKYKYSRPIIHEPKDGKTLLKIKDLRHAIIERLDNQTRFISNDIEFNEKLGYLVFGVNASGKSSLMKSVGLAVIMAQAGMYVPASEMELTPYSQIFTRITKEDDLYSSRSSFQCELEELGNIIKRADARSLVIGDELASGTETASAIGIVGACISKLVEKKCHFVLASHLHELAGIPKLKECDQIRWSQMQTRILDGSVIFCRKLIDGIGSDEYGIEIAASHGLPADLIHEARQIRLNFKKYKKLKTSKYNKSVNYGNICQIDGCSNPVDDIHHIIAQSEADADGYLADGRHKNAKSNLIEICKECHKKITKNDTKLDYLQIADGAVKVINLD